MAAWIEVEQTSDTTQVSRVITTTRHAGAWSAPQAAHETENFLDELSLSRDARNIAVLTWKGYNGYDGDLFASMKDMNSPASNWTAPDTLTNDNLTDWMLTAAVDSQNNLHFVDLKSDLADSTGQVNRGSFFDGLSLGARGIGGDLRLSDDLNFGVHSLAADLKAVDAPSSAIAWPSLGEPDTLTLRVTNIGAVVSGVAEVRFTDGHPDSSGVVFATVTLPAVYPGDTTGVQAVWTPAAGSHSLWAWIDPTNAIPEQTESNNRAGVLLHTVPDIAADSVWVTPDNVIPGATVLVHATLRNIGGLAADSVRVRLTSGATVLADTTLRAFPRGETRTVTRSWTAGAGVTPFTLTADPDSALFESENGNNTATGSLLVLPDLAVAIDSPGVVVQPDSTYRWSARIRNLGGMAADSVSVQFYAGHPLNGGVLLGESVLLTLAARDSALVTVESGPHPGLTRLHVFADRPGRVEERSEENNHADREVMVELLPDLVVTSDGIAFEGFAGPGTPFTITAGVCNLGSAEVVAPTVRFYEGHPDSGGVFIAGRLIPNIPPGQTGSAHCEWTVPDSLPRTFWVQVDRENAVVETNEMNNLAGSLLDVASAAPSAILLPEKTDLSPPVPNPFQGGVLLRVALASPADVRLDVFDVAGRRVRTMVSGRLAAGYHSFSWEGRDDAGRGSAAGVYFFRLQTGGQEIRRKGILLR